MTRRLYLAGRPMTAQPASRKERRRARAEAEHHPSTGPPADVEAIDEIFAGVDEILEENEVAVLTSYRQRPGE